MDSQTPYQPITPENPTGQNPPPLTVKGKPAGLVIFVFLLSWFLFRLVSLPYATKLPQTKPTSTPEVQLFCGGIAGIACPNGYTCKLDGKYPDAGGKCVRSGLSTPPPTPDFISSDCKISGCSGELCLDKNSPDIYSICVYKDEYACLVHARCEKQLTGKCSWTQTPEYRSCISELKI